MIDLEKTVALLAELAFVSEALADRGPIRRLPRPTSEIPDVPLLTARQAAIRENLRVKRNYTEPRGQDDKPTGTLPGHDLTAIGIVEEVRAIEAGKHRVDPAATTIVRVEFENGDHLWFNPNDLEAVA